jgi:hypothetical protein
MVSIVAEGITLHKQFNVEGRYFPENYMVGGKSFVE